MLLVLCSLGFAESSVLSYQQAINLLEKTPQVVLSQKQVELSQKQLAVTSSWLQAELGSGYTLSRGEQSAPSLAEPIDLNEGDIDPIRLTTSFNLIPYGPRFDQVLRSRWEVDRAQNTLKDTRANAVLEITRQFQAALRSKEQIALSEFRLKIEQLSVEATNARLAVGAATEGDLNLAKLSLDRAQQTLQTEKQSYQQTLSNLSLTLGQTIDDVMGPMPKSVFKPDRVDLSMRSDVISAQLAVQEAELQAASTLRDNLPSGQLQLGYVAGNDANQFTASADFNTAGPNGFQPSLSLSYDPDTGVPGLAEEGSSQNFNLGIGLSIPLDVALPAALDAAKIAVEQAKLNLTQAQSLAKLEVDNARLEMETQLANLALSKRSLEVQISNFAISQERFDLGIITQVEHLQAESALLETHLNHALAEDALRLTQLSLAIALALNPLEVY